MILTVTLNPAVDRTITLEDFTIDHINRIKSVRRDIGGKGLNVSKTIAALGGTSTALTLLGGPNGDFIIHEAPKCGLSLTVIPISGNTRENLKLVDDTQKTFTDLNETGPSCDATTVELVKKNIRNLLKSGDFLVLSGSALPGMPPDLFSDLIDTARACKAKVILDVEGEPLKTALLAKPHYIKPNRHELEGLFNTKFDSLEDIKDHALKLIEDGIENVIVSMGSDGLLWVSAQSILHAPALKVPVKSTVGAGDALVAAIAYGLDAHMTPEKIIPLAIATASCVIETEGSQSGNMASLEYYKQHVTFKPLRR